MKRAHYHSQQLRWLEALGAWYAALNSVKACCVRVLGSAALLLSFAIGGQAAAQSIQQVSPKGLADILAEPLLPALGASNGDVTVIEYFDYNCPVCKATEPEIEKLLARDSRVRLIYKDWPIFGASSAYAAYCVFAAAEQGKYQIAHHALMYSRYKLDSVEVIQKVLRVAGINIQQVESAIELHRAAFGAALSRNQTEASRLNLRGTPGLIIGDRLIAGGLDYEQLRQLVAAARKGK